MRRRDGNEIQVLWILPTPVSHCAVSFKERRWGEWYLSFHSILSFKTQSRQCLSSPLCLTNLCVHRMSLHYHLVCFMKMCVSENGDAQSVSLDHPHDPLWRAEAGHQRAEEGRQGVPEEELHGKLCSGGNWLAGGSRKIWFYDFIIFKL